MKTKRRRKLKRCVFCNKSKQQIVKQEKQVAQRTWYRGTTTTVTDKNTVAYDGCLGMICAWCDMERKANVKLLAIPRSKQDRRDTAAWNKYYKQWVQDHQSDIAIVKMEGGVEVKIGAGDFGAMNGV